MSFNFILAFSDCCRHNDTHEGPVGCNSVPGIFRSGKSRPKCSENTDWIADLCLVSSWYHSHALKVSFSRKASARSEGAALHRSLKIPKALWNNTRGIVLFSNGRLQAMV